MSNLAQKVTLLNKEQVVSRTELFLIVLIFISDSKSQLFLGKG